MKESLSKEELTKLELHLIYTAEYHKDKTTRDEAITELKDKFDNSYSYCSYCEGKVIKAKDCCLENGKVILT